MLSFGPVLLLFSALYWLLSVLIMPPMFAVALVIWLVALPFDRRKLALHLFTCLWGSIYIWCSPIWRCRVHRRERIPWRGPAVIVANHASLLDILVLFRLFRPFKWVSKAELGRVPFVGWMLRLNDSVLVRRGDRESVRRMMQKSRAHLAAGNSLLLFPEGTRTFDGKLQAFKDGGFGLAMETGAPVIPVAVKGTFDALPKTGLRLRNGMDCRLEVLEPLYPRDYGSVADLREAARAAIACALEERR